MNLVQIQISNLIKIEYGSKVILFLPQKSTIHNNVKIDNGKTR